MQSHKIYMKRLKEDIPKENQLSNSSSTDNFTPSTDSSTSSTSSSTHDSSTRSSDTYIYGLAIVAVLPIDACVIFYNFSNGQKRTSQGIAYKSTKTQYALNSAIW